MKERPILFSGPMVRALLSGTKTQTRRIVKPQPPCKCEYVINGAHSHALCRAVDAPSIWVAPTPKSIDYRLPCPYGKPGDRLWVQEEHHITLRDPRAVSVRYLADREFVSEVTIGPREHALFTGRKRPDATTRARFMWRCLSRITLEIVSVRVERLQDISTEDSKAEGIEQTRASQLCGLTWRDYSQTHRDPFEDFSSPVDSYRTLWESINGPGSWAENPWVWVVEFRRVEA